MIFQKICRFKIAQNLRFGDSQYFEISFFDHRILEIVFVWVLRDLKVFVFFGLRRLPTNGHELIGCCFETTHIASTSRWNVARYHWHFPRRYQFFQKQLQLISFGWRYERAKYFPNGPLKIQNERINSRSSILKLHVSFSPFQLDVSYISLASQEENERKNAFNAFNTNVNDLNSILKFPQPNAAAACLLHETLCVVCL